ncbi:MAG: hypothetical protein ACI9RU_002638 [Litorivivens sp.]|jgi:hypothetical protein
MHETALEKNQITQVNRPGIQAGNGGTVDYEKGTVYYWMAVVANIC